MQKPTNRYCYAYAGFAISIKSHVPTPHCEDHAHIHEGPDCQSQNESSLD